MKVSVYPPTSAELDRLRRKAAFEFFAKKVLIRALAGRRRKPVDAIDEVVRIEKMLR